MSGALHAVFQNQRSFKPPIPAIGSAYEGGYFAGQISTTGDGVATHNLVIAPKSSGENSSKQWKTSQSDTSGTSSQIDGPTNTANMDNASHPAAQFCAALSIGGFSDWYMPAKDELEVCYFNLKSSTGNNSTENAGANPHAVPARSDYYTNSPKVPDQTSATDFRSGGSQSFEFDLYWTSTQFSSTDAWNSFVGNGLQTGTGNGNYKTYSTYVRAVRRVPV